MNNYKPIEIKQYLEREHIKKLPQQVKDKIVEIRTTWEYVPFDIFRELHTTLRLVKRIKKLVKPRTLYTDGDKIVYFNSFRQEFDVVGYFHTEEFLAERNKKETEERELIEQRKAEKKRAKQALKEVPVKQKRKRIAR
jgi:hypothetical protein